MVCKAVDSKLVVWHFTSALHDVWADVRTGDFFTTKILGCLDNQILLPMVQSNPVNTDTEGARESFLMNGVFVLSG